MRGLRAPALWHKPHFCAKRRFGAKYDTPCLRSETRVRAFNYPRESAVGAGTRPKLPFAQAPLQMTDSKACHNPARDEILDFCHLRFR